jgi:hypothetical protein
MWKDPLNLGTPDQRRRPDQQQVGTRLAVSSFKTFQINAGDAISSRAPIYMRSV